jgi:hypothetical protein
VLLLTLALLAASPPAPDDALTPLVAVPPVLAQARKLAEDLRFEEAVAEYRRYLGDRTRPAGERARALFELAVLHQALADPVTAMERAEEALELDPSFQLPPGTASRQEALLEAAQKRFRLRVKLDLLPREESEPTSRVRARLADPERRVRAILLRHAPAPEGPFWSSRMSCRGEQCSGDLPQPASAAAYTAWYYVEANDPEGNTLARAAGPLAPVQVVVQREQPWFTNPLVLLGGTAVLVGAASVAFIATRPPGAPR